MARSDQLASTVGATTIATEERRCPRHERARHLGERLYEGEVPSETGSSGAVADGVVAGGAVAGGAGGGAKQKDSLGHSEVDWYTTKQVQG